MYTDCVVPMIKHNKYPSLLKMKMVVFFGISLIIIGGCDQKDYESPILNVVYPTNGQTVRDTTIIDARTKDEGGISHVDFFIDDSLYFSDSTYKYQFAWDTKKHDNGEHFIKIISNDESGNFTEERITVIVDNLPGDYYPDKIENFYVWDMDINKPYIYVALDQEGLWRKNYTIENSEWEYMGFSDTSNYAGAIGVTVYGKDIIVAGWSENFWHSLDSGKTWVNTFLTYPKQDREGLHVFKVKRSPHNPTVLIALESFGAFYRSEDGGYAWDKIYGHTNVSSGFEFIVWHDHNSEEVWAFGEGSNWVGSTGRMMGFQDMGASVKVIVDLDEVLHTSGVKPSNIVFNSIDNKIIYFLGALRIFKSVDGGYNWVVIENEYSGINVNYIFKILEDPRSPNSFFVQIGLDKLYYSADGLETFEYLRDIDINRWWVTIKDDLLFYVFNRDIKFISLSELKPL